MANMNFRRLPAALAALALILALAALTGCAGSRRAAPQPAPMTREAQLNYDYLVYQDQMQQLQRHAALGKSSKLTKAEVLKLRENAEAALGRLIEAAPTPQLYLEKAGLFWNDKGGPAQARSILRQGLEAFPDDRMLTVYLANSYLMENRTDGAIDIMEDYLKRHGDDYQARERMGQMLLDAGKDAKALDEFKRIPQDKRNADALYGMGRAQGNLGMRKAAIGNLRKAVEMDPGFTEALVELAYQYELNKDYVSAEKTYTRILGQGDPFPEARLRLINLNLKLNNPARALKVALDGPPTKAFVLDAVLMFINDDFFAQASTVLDTLTTGGEIPAEYYFYKAVIANEGEKDPAKALSYLAKVKDTDRLYPHALRFQAQLHHAQGEDAKALELARMGKKRFPDGPIFYILEANLMRGMGDVKGAEAVFDQGLERLKANPELSYELGMLYETTGRRAEALKLMESVLRSHPDHTNALNYVGYTLAEEGRDLDRALVLVRKASSLDPENGYILDSVAWVYFKMGKLDKAWENIGYAVDVVRKDPTIWEHYGDIAKAMGKISEARKGYSKALKLDSPSAKSVKRKLNAL
ncbi:tetratricopeptide repeat protein [Pseudodesulfovibrio cashew]|uniref:Tetratricopeptide repeat protein n=1 Tax=Pseudodesulfovibrio cashew TaxID=2678688 RepID=A0A6I6JQ81_9BACT|nr:tetratricopeptide repeat protein [Pseudodesulfovibrio cashew]QGY39814.1 tetratricopeptide repeat protein [Pseudodesulfovibrio cashew]